MCVLCLSLRLGSSLVCEVLVRIGGCCVSCWSVSCAVRQSSGAYEVVVNSCQYDSVWEALDLEPEAVALFVASPHTLDLDCVAFLRGLCRCSGEATSESVGHGVSWVESCL